MHIGVHKTSTIFCPRCGEKHVVSPQELIPGEPKFGIAFSVCLKEGTNKKTCGINDAVALLNRWGKAKSMEPRQQQHIVDVITHHRKLTLTKEDVLDTLKAASALHDKWMVKRKQWERRNAGHIKLSEKGRARERHANSN